MKAQISFIEFLVSFAIFASFVVFFSYKIISHVPAYINEIKNERLRAEAYQISEILVNDPGEPEDWYLLPTSQIKRIGLSAYSNLTNFISSFKIEAMKNLCDLSPEVVKEKLGIEEEFYITLKSEGKVLLNCSSRYRFPKAKIVRVVRIDDGRYGRIEVGVW